MMRQIGKQILTIVAWLVLATASPAGGLVTTIITDPLTGVAIDGYDAVSYFIDSEPQPGKPDFEYVWAGVPWYFESAANRDVFMRSPESYAPQFGGHCLMSLSRGYLSDGKPRLFAIEALKLYFFYSSANRDAFLLSRTEALAAATVNWPKLSKDLIAGDEVLASDADGAIPASVAADGAGGNVQSN
ncbi:MAG: hypothetical protein HY834_14980 [Devosia nanyangense]|uniref:YHS domain-containing protein n=1 Tax=Devosia nanyangense TaxID=1228055 RepID=A0A933NZG3_9HYPH|nr:hypothetical protein [Devosia nanyangense]